MPRSTRHTPDAFLALHHCTTVPGARERPSTRRRAWSIRPAGAPAPSIPRNPASGMVRSSRRRGLGGITHVLVELHGITHESPNSGGRELRVSAQLERCHLVL